jgi:hypothetical protein
VLSYGVVLALFLLGPGFATYAGLFFSLRRSQFQSAPPPPNSIFSLGLVGMAALAWHAGWAVLLALNDWGCRHAPCMAVGFEPDVYTAVLDSGVDRGPYVSSPEIAAFLSTCLGLSVAAFLASSAAGRTKGLVRLLRQPLYGLYAGLAEQAAEAASAYPSAYVAAYVLTDVQKDGALLGYFGVLENLQVGPDKQVSGISLLESDTFLLELGPPIQRMAGQRSQLIERIIIGAEHINNLAFEVIDLD